MKYLVEKRLTNCRFLQDYFQFHFAVRSIFTCKPSVNFRQAKLCREYERRTVVRRGTTASSLHPCHLLLPSILASSSCTPHSLLHCPEGPISSSFSPSGPSYSIYLLCTASRLLLLLLTLFLLFLLLRPPPPSPPPPLSFLRPSLLSLSLWLCSVPLCSEIRSSFFSLLLLACPSLLVSSWSGCFFCFRRVNENDSEYAREKEGRAERKKLRAKRETGPTKRERERERERRERERERKKRSTFERSVSRHARCRIEFDHRIRIHKTRDLLDHSLLEVFSRPVLATLCC